MADNNTTGSPSTSPSGPSASSSGENASTPGSPPLKTEFKSAEDSESAFKALGLESTATATEIGKAYRKQALKHHPDKGGEQLKFQQISNAYRYLLARAEKSEAPMQFNTQKAPPRTNTSPSGTNTAQSNTSSPPPRKPFAQADTRQVPPRTNTSRQSGSSNTHSSPPSRNYSDAHSGRRNTQTRNQKPRQSPKTFKLSPMMPTPERPNANAVPHKRGEHAVLGEQKNQDAISRILNSTQLDYPPRCIQQPGKSTEKIEFSSSKDSKTFAMAAAKESIAFKLFDHNQNILAYSNGDGKLYTGKHTEYQPGQPLDPVSPQNFSNPKEADEQRKPAF